MSVIEHDREACRFKTRVDDVDAVLDYTLAGDVMAITHTGVPPQIGGRGVAAQLMQAAVSAAIEQNWRIDPVCSYAAAYLRRHPTDSVAAAST